MPPLSKRDGEQEVLFVHVAKVEGRTVLMLLHKKAVNFLDPYSFVKAVYKKCEPYFWMPFIFPQALGSIFFLQLSDNVSSDGFL